VDAWEGQQVYKDLFLGAVDVVLLLQGRRLVLLGGGGGAESGKGYGALFNGMSPHVAPLLP